MKFIVVFHLITTGRRLFSCFQALGQWGRSKKQAGDERELSFSSARIPGIESHIEEARGLIGKSVYTFNTCPL